MILTELAIHATGPQALVQDHGRVGYRSQGVPRSGAADLVSFDLANRLVGNPAGAAGIECLMGGLSVSVDHRVAVAVTGAPARCTVDDATVALNSTVWLNPGQVLRLGTPSHGLRTYLAVRGGIGGEAVLGSRSTDTLSGLGPAPLAPGDRLPLGSTTLPLPPVDFAAVRGPGSSVVELDVRLGPRADWFANPEALSVGGWVASSQSNRIGLRLDRMANDVAVQRRDKSELPSEPVATGSVQIPPSGQPVVFLADHPVTGGYPVVAVLTETAIARAAQVRPGQHVRFHLI